MRTGEYYQRGSASKAEQIALPVPRALVTRRLSSGVHAVEDWENKLNITSMKLLYCMPLRSKFFTPPCSTLESSLEQYMAANPNQSADCGTIQIVSTKRPVVLKLKHGVRDHVRSRSMSDAKQVMSMYVMWRTGAMMSSSSTRAGLYLPSPSVAIHSRNAAVFV